MGLKPNHRVIEYGCGSLRLGAYFIRYLDPGCYFGLDVIPDFFEMGTELLGEELLTEKKPMLATIGAGALAIAENFQADFVFSTAVAIHVHPDELEIYFENLKRICAKAGAQLHLDVGLSSNMRQIQRDSWVRPLSVYRQGFKPLRLIAAPRSAGVQEGAY